MDGYILWMERISIVKITILSKATYRFNAIPIKIPMAFFTETEQFFLNLYGSTKDPKTILRKKNRAGGIILPDFKIILQSCNDQIVLHWHKNRHINQ